MCMDKKRLSIHIIFQIILFFFLTAADRITKSLAARYLAEGDDVSLIGDNVILHYLENHGAAFGILKNSLWFFYLFTIIILIIVIFLFILIAYRLYKYIDRGNGTVKVKTCRDMVFLNYILMALSAGAVGNLIDRIIHGYVIDFIYLNFIDFPVFNIADICVTVSAFIIVIFFIFIYKEDSNFHIFRKN